MTFSLPSRAVARLGLGLLAGGLLQTPTLAQPGAAPPAASAGAAVAGVPAGARPPPITVPMSAFASDAAKAAFAQTHSASAERPADRELATLRAFYGRSNDRLAERMKAIYPVDIEATTIGGVRAEIIRPKSGVAPQNARRVLINLHGGGFLWGEGSGGEVESIPIASQGKITVITVAYRQGPEHRFPAGSEDVTAVYRALLATHKPSEIGIYGCSAGGILTAQATAWIVKSGLPAPGAIGTFCGSAAPFDGDSIETIEALSGETVPPQAGWPYFAGADLNDPMLYPSKSLEVLAKFPPTLLLAGSRDFAVSSLFFTQRRLTAAGVETELQVWDGMWHAFFINPDLPESREVYEVVVKFFDRHLSR